MKVAVIGLGDIAQKAYLPVFASMKDVEIHLYTRNQEKLTQLKEKYRFHFTHPTLDSLIKANVDAAFVHSSTASHSEIVRQLLENKIAVYVDKPLADDYQTAKSLTELADKKGTILLTGFNRRFAPLYQELAAKPEINMVVMQKNRSDAMAEPRTFVYDDFIHVVDSVCFVLNSKVSAIHVYPVWQGKCLQSLTVQFLAQDKTATAIMNRDSGVSEERLAVMTKKAKYEVENLTELFTYQKIDVAKTRFNDWEDTLYKRGFINIISAFLKAVKTNDVEPIKKEDVLETHRICEEILTSLKA